MQQAINDSEKPRYSGPCPPCGHGEYHHRTILYWLDCVHLCLKEDAYSRKVKKPATFHALDTAELIDMYGH